MKSRLLNKLATLPPEFTTWFGNSKVVDKTGAPLPVYHGSGVEIEEFKYEFAGIGNDQAGSGFYFTTDRDEAYGYTTGTTGRFNGEGKPGGTSKPTVHEVYLSIQNPLNIKQTKPLTAAQVRKFILLAPDLDYSLTNFGDVEYEGKAAVMTTAVSTYMGHGDTTLSALFSLANDFYGNNIEEFNLAVKKILGYDGVVSDFGVKQHWVAFFPNQIKSVKNKTFDSKSPKIMA